MEPAWRQRALTIAHRLEGAAPGVAQYPSSIGGQVL